VKDLFFFASFMYGRREATVLSTLTSKEVGGIQRREFLTLVALTSSSLLALPPLTQQSFADYMMPTDRTRTI
jgi:hypothetical protein